MFFSFTRQKVWIWVRVRVRVRVRGEEEGAYLILCVLCHIRTYICAFGVGGEGGRCISDIVCFM